MLSCAVLLILATSSHAALFTEDASFQKVDKLLLFLSQNLLVIILTHHRIYGNLSKMNMANPTRLRK